MATNSFLERGVDLDHLAEVTKNFSGAEIEGLVKDAAAYALNRNVDFNDLQKPLDEEDIKVGIGKTQWRLCFMMDVQTVLIIFQYWQRYSLSSYPCH